MANKTTVELTPASTPLNGSELHHIVQGGNSRKATTDEIRGPKLKSLVDLATGVGDLIYGLGTGLLARLPKGTVGQVLRMNAGATAPEWADLPLTREYVSPPFAVVSGGVFSLTHGLGAEPKLIAAELIVTTATNGYAVGDKIALGLSGAGQWGTGNSGWHIRKPNATQIVGRFGNNAGGGVYHGRQQHRHCRYSAKRQCTNGSEGVGMSPINQPC